MKTLAIEYLKFTFCLFPLAIAMILTMVLITILLLVAARRMDELQPGLCD
jgi:hypothetical protein